MKKLYSFLPALIFLVFLGVMALLLLFSPVRDYSENEKRYLAGRPEVTVSGILEGETQEQLEKFTADQVPGRDFFVGVNAYWNLATGRNGAQDIYHCKQGYLINAPKTYNEKIFTDNLTKFDQFAAQLGVPADLMMVPSTGYLMEEVLPTFHGTYDDDQLYDKAEQILQNTRLVDVRQALLEGRIAGAGLDTLSPEPVPAGHPLTALPPEVHRKVVLAPHLGGITEASFRRAHAHMWRNVEHLAAGERPDNIVNGL